MINIFAQREVCRPIRKGLAILGCVGLLAGLAAQAQSNIIGVGVPTGSTRNDTYVGAGYEFYAPAGGTTINALGYWDANGTGLLAPHTVSLFKYAGTGSSYNLVVTATIPAGTVAPLINGYRWVGIPSTALPNNGQGGGYYVILAEHSMDTWANSIGTAPYLNPSIGTVSGQGLIANNSTFTVLSSSLNIAGTGNPSDGFGGANLGNLTNALPAAAAPSEITWVANGAFADDAVLGQAGTAADEVYGVDFGGSGLQTTTNGYIFNDYQTTGNVTLGGTQNALNAYLGGGGSTGDPALDAVLNSGIAGDSGTYCILNNLTVGQKYNVLALAADTGGNGTQFQETDLLTFSPAQTFAYSGGTPDIGGYILGTFTATTTNQIFNMFSGDVQYNAILVEKWTPPVYPPIVVVTNPQPATLALGIGGEATYTAAFSNSPAVTVQWQFIGGNGTTNVVTSGVANTTNGGILVSTLTIPNLQAANSGSYAALAVATTNSLDSKYTTWVSLSVNALIDWVQTGTFTNDTVLALAGTPANEVYGVDFGGSGGQTTANGYSFGDYQSSGNMSVADNPSSYGGYITGGATTGDGALDAMLTSGVYGGGNNTGVLNNLTIGQTYHVLVLLDDTRGSAAGGSIFYGTEGVTMSPGQPYAFANGSPAVGGYMLGTFTAASTNEPLTVYNNFPYASQYNAILLAKTQAPIYPPIYMVTNIQPASASVAQGGHVSYSVSFGYSPALNFQWQSVINGVTNDISSGVVNVTDGGITTSTLTLSNIPASAAGSYRLKAIDATNSADFAYSGLASLAVVPVITWTASGTFSSDSVLALVGAPANVVYAVDFGGSGLQTTANGYTFDDGIATGNMTLNGPSDLSGFLTGGATTGDSAFDAVLNSGAYGGPGVTGTLHNLTPGQKYNILVLLDDTRGSGAAGLVFAVYDGLTTSSNQQYAFANGTPAVGGYQLGSITVNSSNQVLSVETSLAAAATFYLASQYNAVIVASVSSGPTAPSLAAPTLAGGTLVLTGAGGTPNSGYTWLQTTNLLPPVVWTTNFTGVLDGTGSFSNSIPIDASQPGGIFFRLRLP